MVYSFTQMQDYGSGWATHVCQQALSLCSHPLWFAAGKGLMLVFYFIVLRSSYRGRAMNAMRA